MLKLSPQSAEGLHKLSQDLQTLYKNHSEKTINTTQNQQPEQNYTVRFGFLDVLKISAYFIVAVALIKTTFLILNW